MNLKLNDAKREEGFTLIELLVVVIIIGILAAIAIPIFLNQRERAWRGSVESDVRNAAIEIETVATRDGSYPADVAAAVAAGVSVVTSDGVTLYYAQGTVDEPAATNGFRICGEHDNITDASNDPNESVLYDSGSGGLGDWNDPAGACAIGTDELG